MKQFETRTTLILGKVKDGATGCGTVRSLQSSKQRVLHKMAYSMDKLMFIVKTFYQTSIS
jgi:murein L,D-transpeptidase YcbB/YkuD